jgi:hypothetical protein
MKRRMFTSGDWAQPASHAITRALGKTGILITIKQVISCRGSTKACSVLNVTLPKQKRFQPLVAMFAIIRMINIMEISGGSANTVTLI